MTKSTPFHLLLPLLLLLNGCAASLEGRATLAQDVAHTSLPVHQLVTAGQFQLTSYARVTAPNATARVYIEGDGLAWLADHEPSLNPTPTDPIALRLAARDTSANVIWLARPCQYEGFSASCGQEYWTAKRFAPEVVEAYNQALDYLKAEYHVTGFELIGFSGGGAIAALVAAKRQDVINLRTVGGNLDHDIFNALHHVSPMPESLNPRDVAAKLSKLPQLHFIGARDRVMPSPVYDSYAKAAGNSSCVHQAIIAGASHEDGWEDLWPQLLAKDVSCAP